LACTRQEVLEEGGSTIVPAGDQEEAGSIGIRYQVVDPEEEDTIHERVERE
jgi:hypothetical protein